MTYVKRRHKCKNCCDFFSPDRRNINKQEYCSKPECRKASKTAAQARWLVKKENLNYFPCTENVQRVQEWRSKHPGYWRNRPKPANALQDHSSVKSTQNQYVISGLTRSALQDHLISQQSVLIGLIAHLTGDTL